MTSPSKEILHYLDRIKTQYRKAKEKKISRFDIWWGFWSAPMNRTIRKKITAGHPESTCLKLVINYWSIVSRLLELHHQHPSRILKRKTKQELKEEATAVKKLIMEGEDALLSEKLEVKDIEGQITPS